MPLEECINPLNSLDFDDLEAILPEGLLAEMRERTQLIHNLLSELEGIEQKGFKKTAEDSVRIKAISRELRELTTIDICVPFSCDQGDVNVDSSQVETDLASSLLERIQVQGDSFATAETDMFTSSWSIDFLHGSDTLLPVMALAESILRPDEVIEAVSRVTWRKPMTSNMQLAVMRGSVTSDPNSVIDGVIKTNQGELTFMGQLIDAPMRWNQAPNPYVSNGICSCENCMTIKPDGTHSFSLHRMEMRDIGKPFQDPAMQTASLAELVTIAVAKIDIPSCRRATLRLMGGLTGIHLSEDPENMFAEGNLDVRVDSEKIRKGKSGFTIIPFTYKFTHQPGVSRGFMAVTDSEHMADEQIGGK